MEPFECSILAFMPFTVDFGDDDEVYDYPATNPLTNYGFSHAASALMAVQHFNARNTTIVPDLAERWLQDCNVTLHLGNGSIIDTGALATRASQRFYEQELQRPCAIVGPFSDLPSIEISILAAAAKAPLVYHRAFNLRLVSNFLSRYSTGVFPDMHATTSALVGYLRVIGRTDFIAFLHGIEETNLQRRETLATEFDEATPRISHLSSSYSLGARFQGLQSQTVHAALSEIKESGYRTIVVSVSVGWDFDELANAVEALGMNNGDYMWAWFDEFAPFGENKNLTKLLDGSLWVVPVTGSELDPESDPFWSAWAAQGTEEVVRLNSINPIREGDPGYRFAEDGFFQNVPPEYGSSSMYDAVMSVGIGACTAEKNGVPINGTDLVDSIRSVDFAGATGRVAFGNDENDADRLGTRLASTISWAALNIRYNGGEADFVPTGILVPDSGDGVWQNLDDFVFRGGTTTGPLLRSTPDQNYLPASLRAFGLALMGVSILASVSTSLWVYIHRKHRVLRASQPLFLYLICFGTLLQGASILTISFDESTGWSSTGLDMACMATPWLLLLGFIIVYGSLWTKMNRVNNALQFTRRRKTKTRYLLAPMVGFVVLAVMVLTVWNAVDPLVWTRTEIDSVTGESIGICNCDHYAAFMAPLVVVAVIPAFLTALLAWKTRDVDESFTESWYIFVLILLQLEVMIIAAPIIVILRDLDSTGRYIGIVLMLWVFPISTLTIIMVPKYMHYRRVERGTDDSSRVKRGQHFGVHVTGIPNPSNLTDPSRLAMPSENSEPTMSHPEPIAEASEEDVQLSQE